MFDLQYYKNKKQTIVQQIQVLNAQSVQKMFNVLTEHQQRVAEIQKALEETDKIIEEMANIPKEEPTEKK